MSKVPPNESGENAPLVHDFHEQGYRLSRNSSDNDYRRVNRNQLEVLANDSIE